MRIDCIIVEDEPLAQERIKGYLEKLPFMNLAGVFDGAMEAMTFLQNHTVDLIFLDINMGDFSGIQLLETMKLDSQVVLSTAYHEYALKGYELNVTDYLLKPYTFERFLQAVDKVRQQRVKDVAPDRKFIFVKTEYRLERIQLDNLIYVEGMRDYRKIYVTGKQIMTLQTFGELEQLIPPGWVCRIHKSYLVALARIDSVGRDTVRIGDLELPLSDTYRRALLEMIQR